LKQFINNPADQRKRPVRLINPLLAVLLLLVLLLAPLTAQNKKSEPVDTFVQDVKAYSEKDGFFSRIVKGILVNEEAQQTAATVAAQDGKLIRKFTGKIIRKINIEVLDVFGASVDDPDDSIRTWVQDRGNSLHMKTKEWLIKNKLIFSEGLLLMPFDILESERIIRQSPYVYDVRIFPRMIKNNPDSVDIMVYVQVLHTGPAASPEVLLSMT
jgi:hypothetical protein